MSDLTYNRLQQIFAINWLSNTLSDLKGDASKFDQSGYQSVTNILNDSETKSLIGEWELVWGPHTYCNKPKDTKAVVDNTMLLVKSAATNTYILAIAGTNPISSYGWLTEDFQTNVAVDWPFSSDANTGKISQGTNIGLQKLLNMPFEVTASGFPKPEVHIVDFLKAINKEGISQTELIVTGHSLGGALSASLALALKNMQTAEVSVAGVGDNIGNWDPDEKFVVSALPSAGATPGDTVFAAYYDKELAARTIRIWNHIDVVPHGWQEDMLKAVPSLYSPAIPSNFAIEALAEIALKNSKKSGATYYQIMEEIGPLDGKVNTGIINKDEIESLIDSLGEDEVTRFIELILKAIAPKYKWLDGIIDLWAHKLAEVIVAYLSGNISSEIQKLIDGLPDLAREGLKDLYKEFNGLMLFMVQLGYQHVQAYIEFMGIPCFTDVMKKYKPASI